MKQWGLDILMFVFALAVLSYGIVILCLEPFELSFQCGIAAICDGIMAVIILILGSANTLEENKDEQKNRN